MRLAKGATGVWSSIDATASPTRVPSGQRRAQRVGFEAGKRLRKAIRTSLQARTQAERGFQRVTVPFKAASREPKCVDGSKRKRFSSERASESKPQKPRTKSVPYALQRRQGRLSGCRVRCIAQSHVRCARSRVLYAGLVGYGSDSDDESRPQQPVAGPSSVTGAAVAYAVKVRQLTLGYGRSNGPGARDFPPSFASRTLLLTVEPLLQPVSACLTPDTRQD